MTLEEKKKWLVHAAFAGGLLAAAWLVVNYLAAWLMPFLLGFLFAVLLQKPINFAVKHTRLSKKVVAPALTALMVFVILTAVAVTSAYLASEAASFLGGLPSLFRQTAPRIVQYMNQSLDRVMELLPPEWEHGIRQGIGEALLFIQSQLGHLSSVSLSWIANRAALLPTLFAKLVITVVVTFFIAADYDEMKAFLRRQLPKRFEDMAGEALRTLGRTIGQIFRSYLLLMLITFCELSVGLTILRVEYGVILAALISFVDILPVLGTGTVLIPWGVISILFGDWLLGIGLLLLYLIITIVRNILEPRMIGKRIGVHPLVTLLLMYLGLRFFGIIGMFLFPFAFILAKNARDAGLVKLWK